MTKQETEDLYRALRSRLKGFLYVQYYNLSQEEHEDIIQDTFVLLLKNPQKWTDIKRDCFPLMCEMVKRRAKDRLRHYRMRDGKSERIYAKYSDTVLQDPATINMYDLDSDLTERQAEILALKMQGYEYKEIMSKLGIAKSTVNTTLDVVRKKLRSKLSSHRHLNRPTHQYQT